MLRRSRRGAAHASSPPSGAEAATEGDAGSDSDEGSPGGGSPRAPRLRGAARRKAGARASVAWLASQAAHGDDGDGAGSLFAEDVLAGVAAAAQHEGEARGRRDARLRPKTNLRKPTRSLPGSPLSGGAAERRRGAALPAFVAYSSDSLEDSLGSGTTSAFAALAAVASDSLSSLPASSGVAAMRRQRSGGSRRRAKEEAGPLLPEQKDASVARVEWARLLAEGGGHVEGDCVSCRLAGCGEWSTLQRVALASPQALSQALAAAFAQPTPSGQGGASSTAEAQGRALALADRLRVVYFDAQGQTREASAGDDGGSSQWSRMARTSQRLFALYSA